MKPASAAALLLGLIASCRAPAADQEAGPRYALMPLRNLTLDLDAPGLLSARIRQVLSERGAEFVPTDELERILLARRIRYVDTLSVSSVRAIAAETGATHALVGTLLAYEPGFTPRIALSLRVVECAEGKRVQSSLVSLSGDDFTGILGLGTIEDLDTLSWEVVARSTDMFDARGSPRPVEPHLGEYLQERDRRPQLRFVDPSLRLEPGTRIAVFPFVNRTTLPQAGLLFVDVLTHAWLQAREVEAVETAELLEAMARARVRSIEGLDSVALGQVAQAVGARYLVLGSVESLEYEVPVFDELLPELEVWLRVVDAETGRFVGGAGVRRRGDYQRGMLDIGIERDPVRLALSTAAALLATLTI